MMVFLHVMKTAGTTFQFILENTFGIRHCHMGHIKKKCVSPEDLGFARKMFPWMRSIAGENLLDPPRLPFPDPFYMVFLREPVGRVFSHYQDDVVRSHCKLSFEEKLASDERLENLHVKMIAGERNLDKAKDFLSKCHFVGLTEKFDLSLHILRRLSPCKLNLNYKRKLAAPNNEIKRSLERDARIVEMVRDHNRLDLELYAFALNEIFPRMCARAGYKPSDSVESFDRYSSDVKPVFLLHRFYNQLVFRQTWKLLRGKS